jgi:hypothetical protein
MVCPGIQLVGSSPPGQGRVLLGSDSGVVLVPNSNRPDIGGIIPPEVPLAVPPIAHLYIERPPNNQLSSLEH